MIVECKRFCPAPVQMVFKFKGQKHRAGKHGNKKPD